jgi:DNA-directed RNA polymerase subunit L
MGDLPDDVIVSTSDSRMIGYDFLFQKHDHTLGNLLQTWLVEHHIEGNEEPKVTYAGYAVPHPLRDEMVLRIGVADRSEQTARLAIAMAAKGCVTMFTNLRAKWREAIGSK